MTEPAFEQERVQGPWIDGRLVAVVAADTLDTRRLGYVYDSLAVLRDGIVPAGGVVTRVDMGQPLAVATLRLPPGTGPPRAAITGVTPTDRPLPGSSIIVGVHAIGRKHSAATFPDTQLRFDITSAVDRLGAPAVVVSVVPLVLGPDQSNWPAFKYAGMEVLALPA